MASSHGRVQKASSTVGGTVHNEIRIVHGAVRGRVRLHVPYLYRNDHAASVLQQSLTEQPGVRAVAPNVLTGNLLVLFGPDLSVADVVQLVVAIRTHVPRRSSMPPTSVASGRATKAAPTGPSGPGLLWHALGRGAVLARLEATAQGLTSDEARNRLQRVGANELRAAVRRPLSDIVVAQFKSLPVVLLIGSAVASVLTGGLADAGVIIGVIAINAVIGAYTEAAAERTIVALTRFSAPPQLTERDRRRGPVEVASLVPGDVIHVTRGDYVPADARLLDSSDLSVAESALTGESAPVSKDAHAIVDGRAPLADRTNMLYRGTVVTGGTGVAVVVATGTHTEIGRIQELVSLAAPPETPLQQQLSTLGQQMAVVTGIVSASVVAIGVMRGYRLLEIVRVGISLAVAAIPEGLPTVSTMTLATGVRRLRERGLLVRRLDAVETLGAVQVICLDKTGTITANRMVAQSACVDRQRVRFDEPTGGGGVATGTPDATFGRLLRVAVLCSEASVQTDGTGQIEIDGTPTEGALIHLAVDHGLDVVGLRVGYPLVSRLARAERRMFMETVHATPEGRRLIATKGRPDQVLSRCRTIVREGSLHELTDADRTEIEAENEFMAGQGLRVLGFGFAETPADGPSEETPLTWLGLVGIADPPRPGIRSIVQRFRSAGIQVVMITGDQSATACAVARAIALTPTPDLEVLDSTGLAGVPDDLLSALARRVDVFSRVSPSNKLQIVRALQRAGLIVAMTGDGVNDGPALRASDVGVAMGRGGSELAREVANIVLLEDDVSALVDAIVEGRTTADDIRKSVHFIISTNLSEVLLTVVATAFGFGVPLNATQLLWINLLTDVFPELALAVDPAESDVLSRPPRASNEKLVASTDFQRLAMDASVMTGAALTSYLIGLRRYGNMNAAGTMAFYSLTAAQLLHAFSSRSEARSALEFDRPSNSWLDLSVVGGFGVQGLAAVAPWLRRLLGTVHISPWDVALSWSLAGFSFVASELLKIVTRGTARHKRDPTRLAPLAPLHAPAGSVIGRRDQ